MRLFVLVVHLSRSPNILFKMKNLVVVESAANAAVVVLEDSVAVCCLAVSFFVLLIERSYVSSMIFLVNLAMTVVQSSGVLVVL